VWAWGLNSSGQLGNGRVANGYGASEVLGVGGNGFLTGIVAIAAGDSFSLAVDASGNVYAWGDDSAGQLGDNRSGVGVQSWTPIRVHGLNNVGNLGGVLAIAARSNGADALNSDHTVTAWGTGNQPQSLFPILVNNSGNTAPLANQTAVGASFNTTLTIDNDTSLWNWGDNSHGQLGDNTTTFRPNAVHVYNIGGGPSVLAGVVEATGGVGHSVALLTGGTVAAWGWNSAGQLGDNTFTDRPTAVQTAMPVAAAPTSC
jgi:alpha-tubulin suppressor-like RCC1 family protein